MRTIVTRIVINFFVTHLVVQFLENRILLQLHYLHNVSGLLKRQSKELDYWHLFINLLNPLFFVTVQIPNPWSCLSALLTKSWLKDLFSKLIHENLNKAIKLINHDNFEIINFDAKSFQQMKFICVYQGFNSFKKMWILIRFVLSLNVI